MAKSKSHKQPNKAAKTKKAAKPAEAPEVQVSAPTEPQFRPDTSVASEPSPAAAVPPAPEVAAAEPAAAEIAPGPTESVDAEPEPAAPAQAKKALKEAKPKKVSALDAAARVLAEAGAAMTAQAMIEAMAAKGYWSSPADRPLPLLFTAPSSES